jgi:hypothetical protein
MTTTKHSYWGDFFADMRKRPLYFIQLNIISLLAGIGLYTVLYNLYLLFR